MKGNCSKLQNFEGHFCDFKGHAGYEVNKHKYSQVLLLGAI